MILLLGRYLAWGDDIEKCTFSDQNQHTQTWLFRTDGFFLLYSQLRLVLAFELRFLKLYVVLISTQFNDKTLDTYHVLILLTLDERNQKWQIFCCFNFAQWLHSSP